MPTLVWIRRPKKGGGTSGAAAAAAAAAGGEDGARAAAAPEPVASAAACTEAVPPDSAISASSDPVQGASPPAISSKRCAKAAAGGKKRKRKIGTCNRAKAGTTAAKKRKSKTTSDRDLPRGVTKTRSEKFESRSYWNGKIRYIGTFDTPEQASAAHMSVRKDLDDAKLSALGVDEAKAAFVEVKKKALESFGGLVSEERDLPTGVYKLRSGKFKSQIWWGGKKRHIGTFDTPEQASAAHMSARKDLDDAKLRSFGSHEVKEEATFDAAKKKALEALATR